jgi:4-hydroxybenzoate polyprenyltransferase
MRSLAVLMDIAFLTRPMLWIPVWGFSVFGYRCGSCAGGDIVKIPLWSIGHTAALAWMIVFSFSVGAVYVMNQIADYEVDRVNDGFPLLVKVRYPRGTLFAAIVACAMIGCIAPLAHHAGVSALSLAALALGGAYSVKPAYLSGRPVADFLANAAGYGWIAFGAGWALSGTQVPLFSAEYLRASMPYFLLMCAGSLSSTIPDMAGDARGGKRTTAVALGASRAHALACAFLAVAAAAAVFAHDTVAGACAGIAMPIYAVFLFRRTRIWMEATYKIGGGAMMIAAGVIMPAFAAAAAVTFGATWLYFRMRHRISYPSLVPVQS